MERYKVFTGLIANISRCIQKIKNAEMAALGFQGRQVRCLFLLYSLDKGASLTELSYLAEEDKGMLSRTVKGLIAEGLVYVEEQGAQKYRNPLKLTENGKEIARQVTDKIALMLEMGSDGVSDVEREQLYSILTRISENLNKICEKYEGGK